MPDFFELHVQLTSLVDRLDEQAIHETGVIEWGSPIPAFGDVMASRVASVGLNPSNREFVDASGDELEGTSRRFHTLNSLRLSSWAEVDSRHLRLILESCRSYFQENPYDGWFRKLDSVIVGTGASYYDVANPASHLDLIPYATASKWTDLSGAQRLSLLAASGDVLGLVVRDAPIEVLILNGQAVVDAFERLAGVSLNRSLMPEWSLPRRASADVAGTAYSGTVTRISGVDLGRSILVLGFNHNLQSSFGVTTEVVGKIREWISRMVDGSDS